MILIFCMLLLLFIVTYHVLKVEYTDWCINIAQARVDAGTCLLFLHHIETYDGSYGHVDVFDLPFLDLTHQPTYWWYAVWEWDFLARTHTMILADQLTSLYDGEFYSSIGNGYED
jgi:hypothetical protein